MNGFSILMLIFGIMVLLTGLYMYKGHKINALSWRAPYQNLSIDKWINIGKWTMITSIIPFILSIVGLFFKD